MQKYRSTWEHVLRLVAIVALLAGLAAGATSANAVSTAINNGFVDLVYGLGTDDQPTSATAESKLWYTADGLWWGALFNGATNKHEIFRYNVDADSWVYTGFALDTRYDVSEAVQPPDPAADVDNQFDVLFENNKLYIASRISVMNAGWTGNDTQWGKLFRYTYTPATKAYTLDTGYPVNIAQYRTESMAIDMEPDLTLWATWVTRPQGSAESHVFVNWSNAALGGQASWPSPVGKDLTTIPEIGAAAKVSNDDISAVITYGTKTAVIWSNDYELTPAPARTTVGKFYYAEHDNTLANDTGWTLTDLTALYPTATANDHIHPVADAAGNLYIVVKTNNVNTGNDFVGVFKRDALTGLWGFTQVTETGGVDTNPNAVLNETTGNLHVFVASNEGGGLICNFPVPTATMTWTIRNCNSGTSNSMRLIYDATTYTHFNNPTSTKQNVTTAGGALVIAADDPNHIYGHNMIGGPTTAAPDIIAVTPVENGMLAGAQVIVTARFSKSMKASTINSTTFSVTGPGGVVAGTLAYDTTTKTATFTSTPGVILAGGLYTASITAAVQDSGSTPLVAPKAWSFTYTFAGNTAPTVTATTPADAGVQSGPLLVASATFSEPMNPATLNTTTFTVTGPGGPVTGTVMYNAATNTATFTSAGMAATGSYTATITTGAQDADPIYPPLGLAAPKTWTFTHEHVQTAFPVYLPSMFR